MKILLADKFNDAFEARLRELGEVSTSLEEIADVDVLVVRSKTKVTKDLIARARRLGLVIRGGVGLDNVDAAACRERGIQVRNTPAASSVAVAELAMTLMLAAANRVVFAHNEIASGRFPKKDVKRVELGGKTLGLIGAGLIGQAVAARAAAFGMKVIAYDPFVKRCEAASLVGSAADLYRAAAVLSLHAPLNDETRGMLGRAAIVSMKDGVIVVNTARGELVDEQAMAEALVSGKVRAYAADVFHSEPPSGSPLLSAPNTVFTPHVGASTAENMTRIGDIVVEILSNWGRAG
ncbi:MAG: hydroxyacid dehydrogenase [Deltaproteobacteria bacterium]|nr:hydroxyacid dehydrogenase [Deltaproteobacteria bacterium]